MEEPFDLIVLSVGMVLKKGDEIPLGAPRVESDGGWLLRSSPASNRSLCHGRLQRTKGYRPLDLSGKIDRFSRPPISEGEVLNGSNRDLHRHLKGSIPLPSGKGSLPTFRDFHDIAFCMEDEDLDLSRRTGRGWRSVLKGRRWKGLSSSEEVPNFMKPLLINGGIALRINPYLSSRCECQGTGLWADGKRRCGPRKKPRVTITKAIRYGLCSRTRSRRSLSPLKPEVLVLGGGIVGISIALGIGPIRDSRPLLEKGKELGRKGFRTSRSFITVLERFRNGSMRRSLRCIRRPNITVFTQAELKAPRWPSGSISGQRSRARTERRPFSPLPSLSWPRGIRTQREREGIYGHKRMITLSEMEKLLSEASSVPSC